MLHSVDHTPVHRTGSLAVRRAACKAECQDGAGAEGGREPGAGNLELLSGGGGGDGFGRGERQKLRPGICSRGPAHTFVKDTSTSFIPSVVGDVTSGRRRVISGGSGCPGIW